MAGVGDLHALAEEMLQVSVDALDTLAPGFGGSPARAFVTYSEPVADCCPQITVHVSGIRDAPTQPGGMAAGKRHTIGKRNYVTLITTLFRCVPTEVEPPVAEMEAAAEQINNDGWALWNYVFNEIASGRFRDYCSEAIFDGIRPIRASGGCGGWLVQTTFMLDGYLVPT